MRLIIAVGIAALIYWLTNGKIGTGETIAILSAIGWGVWLDATEWLREEKKK